MTDGAPVAQVSGTEAEAGAVRGESETVPTPQPEQRVWTMPAPEVTRKKTDEAAQLALRAGTAAIGFMAGVARYTAASVKQLARAIEAVPPTVRMLTVVGILLLLGIVGAIAAPGALGLVCIVMVVPVCSITLGALGHRWLGGLGGQPMPRVESPVATPSTPDLQRSVEYVDKKLTVALNAFGAERQQHAMIALFQAKTAVELTLGTEQDATTHIDALVAVDGHDARPRIRAGAKSLRESNSLAAS